MRGHYILEGREPKAVPLLVWAEWFETANRHIGDTSIPNKPDNDIRVSTVFLGLNYNYGDGPPLLFETMVFGGKLDQEQWRYSTYAEAEKGHDEAVQKATNALKEGADHD